MLWNPLHFLQPRNSTGIIFVFEITFHIKLHTAAALDNSLHLFFFTFQFHNIYLHFVISLDNSLFSF